MNGLIHLLQKSLFGCLDQEVLRELATNSIQRTYRVGEWIVRQGEVWPYLFIVGTGKATAIKDSFEGRSLNLTSFEGGEIFWGLAFFHEDVPNPAGFQVSKAATLYLWPREQMLPFIMQNGSLSWEIARLTLQRVQIVSEVVEKLAFQPVASRLAALLLEQSSTTGSGQQHRDLTLDEMAARIGSTREVVSRFLHRFYNEGIINITRTEFSIMDRQRLEELAQKVKGEVLKPSS
jgi:CRP/FNR family transcriptional regulator